MAHVQKHDGRPKPYEVLWRVDTRDGKRFRQQSFRTRKEAEVHKRTVEARASDYDPNDGAVTLAAYVDRWLATRGRASERTLRDYRITLDKWVLGKEQGNLGHLAIKAVRRSDIEAIVLLMREAGRSPATIRHVVLAARSVFGMAVSDRLILHNPCEGVQIPTAKTLNRAKFQPHFLTGQQVEALATAFDEDLPLYGLLVRFLAYTGLRASELAGLNVEDVRMGRVHVHRTRDKRAQGVYPAGWHIGVPKTERSTRAVPIPQALRPDLGRYLAEVHGNPQRGAPLFPGRGKAREWIWDEPWERGTFYKNHFKPALLRAGLPMGVRIHDLRHTYASLCASAGAKDKQVSAWLGHENVVTTLTIYSHLFAEDEANELDKLNTLLGGAAVHRSR